MIKCRMCGENGEHKLYRVKEMMIGTREEFDYFECRKCGTLQIKTIPDDLSKFYPNNYYSFSSRISDNNKLRFHFLKKLFARVLLIKGLGTTLIPIAKSFNLNYLLKFRKNGCSQKSKILDVGSGVGRKIYKLKSYGFDLLYGSDPFIESDINYSSGLIIYKKTLYDFDEKFDLIMFNHSFEHMSDPLKILEQTNKLLNNGGKCMIRIPVTKSYAWEHYKENWVALDAPRHIHLLNIDSMNIIASKANFKIVDFEYESSEYQFFGSEQYKRGIPLMADNSFYQNPDKSIFSAKEIKQFKKEARKLNENKRGDIICFYLEKK